VGFFQSWSTYTYCAAMFALGLLAWWSWRRLEPRHSFVRRSLWIGFWVFVVWGGINGIRGLLPDNVGRTIFSFLHPDIDLVGFAYQEFRSFILCCLVAYTWLAHGQLAANRAESQAAQAGGAEDESFDPIEVCRRAVDLGGRFDNWHIDSTLLAVGFFPWTVYYWSLGHRWDDPRYYVSTLVWHLVWGITWWSVSSSLLSDWRNFNHYRAHVQARLLLSGRADGNEAKIHGDALKARREFVDKQMQWITDIRPVSTTHLVFAAVASIVTFLLPVLKALK
jgi:hypothetical protein